MLVLVFVSDTLNIQVDIVTYHTYADSSRSCKVAVPRSATSYSRTFGD